MHRILLNPLVWNDKQRKDLSRLQDMIEEQAKQLQETVESLKNLREAVVEYLEWIQDSERDHRRREAGEKSGAGGIDATPRRTGSESDGAGRQLSLIRQMMEKIRLQLEAWKEKMTLKPYGGKAMTTEQNTEQAKKCKRLTLEEQIARQEELLAKEKDNLARKQKRLRSLNALKMNKDRIQA